VNLAYSHYGCFACTIRTTDPKRTCGLFEGVGVCKRFGPGYELGGADEPFRISRIPLRVDVILDVFQRLFGIIVLLDPLEIFFEALLCSNTLVNQLSLNTQLRPQALERSNLLLPASGIIEQHIDYNY
jgi:hypothetical protein